MYRIKWFFALSIFSFARGAVSDTLSSIPETQNLILFLIQGVTTYNQYKPSRKNTFTSNVTPCMIMMSCDGLIIVLPFWGMRTRFFSWERKIELFDDKTRKHCFSSSRPQNHPFKIQACNVRIACVNGSKKRLGGES